MTLNEAEIEAVAARVVELLGARRSTRELVDASEIARRFGVSRAFVYDHASDLGAIRLGAGPRARLRFDPAQVDRLLGSDDSKGEARRPARRRPARGSGALLPIRRAGEK